MNEIRPRARKNTLLRIVAREQSRSSVPASSPAAEMNEWNDGPSQQAHDASREEVAWDEEVPFRGGDQFLHWMPVH